MSAPDPGRAQPVSDADFLRFLADGGVLDLPIDRSGVERIRIELTDRQCLHLQSIGVVTADQAGPGDLARRATVTASSWYKTYGERFDARRLFDFENSAGTQVHTDNENAPWIDISFARPQEIAHLRLRNVNNGTFARAASVRVRVQVAGRWIPVFEADTITARLTSWVLQAAQAPAAEERSGLEKVVGDVIAGRYAAAYAAFNALTLEGETKNRVKAVLNAEILRHRNLEWTIHGPRRCFRYWTPGQKRLYTHLAATIADELSELTPHVCFGFGAVLSVVRDQAFIPHDDDLDIIIGFEPDEAGSLPAGLRRVEEFLRPRGYSVTGNFSAHRQVSWGGKSVDVFVGLFEGDVISWYPGPRGALTRQLMFPVSVGSIYGVEVPLPREPRSYLEGVYGPGWVTPNPNFQHTWDHTAYADLARPRADRS